MIQFNPDWYKNDTGLIEGSVENTTIDGAFSALKRMIGEALNVSIWHAAVISDKRTYEGIKNKPVELKYFTDMFNELFTRQLNPNHTVAKA